MGVYTRTGDNGSTSLIGGERVSKTDLRIEAYGTVDELSAFVAQLYDSIEADDEELSNEMTQEKDELVFIITKLMDIEALFAAERSYYDKLPQITDDEIKKLELAIDRMSAVLPKIFKFTLPIGHPLISKAHICRTVCRRAECTALRCKAEFDISDEAIKFLNRLSDYLYT
ncbi:MAG: cob(I)yrinic acid a,c-diamide adenosyltransferase, partial [Rikenellaceae bacterium]